MLCFVDEGDLVLTWLILRVDNEVEVMISLRKTDGALVANALDDGELELWRKAFESVRLSWTRYGFIFTTCQYGITWQCFHDWQHAGRSGNSL